MCQCLQILCSKCFSAWGNFLAPVFLLQLIMYTLSLNCSWARILIGSQGALLESKIHLGFLLVIQLGPDSLWTAPLKSFANFPSFSPSPVESLLDCKRVYLWIRPCLPRALINIQSFPSIYVTFPKGSPALFQLWDGYVPGVEKAPMWQVLAGNPSCKDAKEASCKSSEDSALESLYSNALLSQHQKTQLQA